METPNETDHQLAFDFSKRCDVDPDLTNQIDQPKTRVIISSLPFASVNLFLCANFRLETLETCLLFASFFSSISKILSGKKTNWLTSGVNLTVIEHNQNDRFSEQVFINTRNSLIHYHHQKCICCANVYFQLVFIPRTVHPFEEESNAPTRSFTNFITIKLSQYWKHEWLTIDDLMPLTMSSLIVTHLKIERINTYLRKYFAANCWATNVSSSPSAFKSTPNGFMSTANK